MLRPLSGEEKMVLLTSIYLYKSTSILNSIVLA